MKRHDQFIAIRILRSTFALWCTFASQPLLHSAPQGYVIEWGWNTAAGTAAPAKEVLNDATAISAGRLHCLALKGDGSVVQLGVNFRGEATFDNTVLTTGEGGSDNTRLTNTIRIITNGVVKIKGQVLSQIVSIAAGDGFSLALKKDGTIVAWGENYVPTALTNIMAIAADEAHGWVLKRNGTVAGWFREPSPTFGLIPIANLSNIVAIAAGSGPQGATRGVALRRDGTVGHWGGETDYKDATPPAGLSNVVAIAAGASHSLALKSDGTAIGWGFNNVGQATGIPATNSPYISSGQVNLGGQVLSNVVSIAAGRGYSLALRKDGTVIAWGRMVNDLYPATVPAGLSNVVAIAAGAEDFCLALTTNKTVAEQFRNRK